MLNVILDMAYLAAIGLSAYTSGWLITKAGRNRVTGALVACQLLIILWCIPQLFSGMTTTREMKFLAYAISYVGISFIGPAWMEFAFLYSKRKLNRVPELFLFGIAVVNYAMLLTNGYHHLFYRVFEVERVEYGPVFYIHMGYTYLCVLAGMTVVLRDFKKNNVAWKHIFIILTAAAVPLGFNLIYMMRLVKSGFDLTPPAFALSSILMLLAVFRYDMLDVNTTAFEKIFAEIAEGVAVYNSRGKITYCNGAAARWFGMRPGEPVDNYFEETSFTVREMPQVITLPSGEWIEVKQYQYRDASGRKVSGTLLFTDVGKYYELLEREKELAVTGQKLAVERERNRIAQEVHDTTGHTLTMIQSLLKLMDVAWADGEKETFEDCMKQGRELASRGIRELRCSINQMRQPGGWESVTRCVRQLAESVREMEIEVEIKGTECPEHLSLSPVVYGCMREAITNCLRYAGATHMDVILKFLPGELSVYIFDNGAGCDTIKEGNGLRGIRERVEDAGGQVRFRSEPNGGFQTYISLPVTQEHK